MEEAMEGRCPFFLTPTRKFVVAYVLMILINGCTTPPVAATVFFEANDAALPGRASEAQPVPLEEYKENLRKTVRHLKGCSPTMLIVLITPPPIDEEGRQEFAKSMYGEKAMKAPERTNEVTGTYANGCVEDSYNSLCLQKWKWVSSCRKTVSV